MKHPPNINGIEQMFSVWMVRDGTLKPAAKQNKKILRGKNPRKQKQIFMEMIISLPSYPI